MIKHQAPPQIRAAFTLIEVLVVVMIILILMGITIPLVGRARTSAQAAATLSFITQLEGAIERYHMDHYAFPGPLSNDAVFTASWGPNLYPPVYGASATARAITSDTITMSENLVLGLLGGLRTDPNVPANGAVLDLTLIGSGPRNLNPAYPKSSPAYIDAGHLSKSGARYSDDVTTALDSVIPEFVDAFTNSMPILYLRARPGAPNIISERGLDTAGTPVVGIDPLTSRPIQTHYDLSQIIAYTASSPGAPPLLVDRGNPPAVGITIGVGKDLDEYVTNGTPKAKKNVAKLYHGLRLIDKTAALTAAAAAPRHYEMPFDAYSYFAAVHEAGPDAIFGTADDIAVPRQKDGYMLISAGKDRVYGTADDLTSFGSVLP
jgi:prepilin-type N-terminal cleavage/methylation domain-containing protein